tara:strand:- start:346 stop:822 length:477 start_codon:yes stop_codon:yes gene_type:complete
MFKKLFLTFFLLFTSFLFFYPSKKENINLTNYCYALEKILFRNLVEKSENESEKFKSFAKDIMLFGNDKTKGALVSKIIDQYKNSKELYILTIVPNQFYCLGGYWIEVMNPGKFQSIFFEKGKQRINQYKDIKIEADQLIKDINSEYKSIKIEIKKLF